MRLLGKIRIEMAAPLDRQDFGGVDNKSTTGKKWEEWVSQTSDVGGVPVSHSVQLTRVADFLDRFF